GSQGVYMANTALACINEPEFESSLDLGEMWSKVQDMLIDGLEAFTSGDPKKARATIERDDEVDSLYDIWYSDLINAIQRDSSLVDRGVQWMFVIKHLERIADYVTNICEQIVYMSRGQVI